MNKRAGWAIPAILLCWCGTCFLHCLDGVSQVWGQTDEPQVLRVGLSRVQDTSLLTVVLNQALQPQVYPLTAVKSPQLLLIFPEAQASHLPEVLPGDQELVYQVRTLATPGRKGVRIILDIYPGRPYVYWRQLRPGPNGTVHYLVGLQPDSRAEPRQSPGLRLPERPRPGLPPAPSGRQPTPSPRYYERQEERPCLETAAFQELAQLAPSAAAAFRFLEQDGWSVARQHASDQPGRRFSQRFLLTNPRYPELEIKFSHIAGISAVSPDINFLTLTTENLSGDTADKYREMLDWSTSKIKQHYEDIGDYYSDGLKPLRIILREQTKALALRRYDFFRRFLQAACPQHPEAADQILAKIQDKVNKRLDGVQYTISENPLVILNLVDFLYVRIYFLG